MFLWLLSGQKTNVCSLGKVVIDLTKATHIIHHNEDPVHDANQPMRPFTVKARQSGRSLLHYIGLPSSYDSWVNDQEYDMASARPLDTTPTRQWPYHLKASWVKDSYTYNEWMDHGDYSYSMDGDNNNNNNLKRYIEEDATDDTNGTPPKKVKPIENPTSLQQQQQQQHSHHQLGDHTLLATSTTSSNQDQQTSIPQSDQTSVPATSSYIEHDIIQYRSIQGHDITIPSYAAWFELGKVNDIERNSLPEFFSSKSKWKTPTIYKDYRDFMVNSYRINPMDYLTITACRRNLMGDVCAIIRVHSFLEQWGLINYQVDPSIRPPSSLNAPAEVDQLQAVTIKSTLPSTTNAITNQLVDMDVDSKTKVLADDINDNPAAASVDQDDSDSELKAIKHDSDGDTKMDNNNGNSGQCDHDDLKCATCETQSMEPYYQHSKQLDVKLCGACYFDGKYSMNLRPSEFIKRKRTSTAPSTLPSPSLLSPKLSHSSNTSTSSPPSPSSDHRNESWTDEENTLLEEGMKKYYNDWSKIADHIKTRTRDQCLLHYLQLPMEDPYVDTEVSKLGLLQFDQSSNSAENSIMSTVAFMASTVKPHVAAAAAGHAPRDNDAEDDDDKKQPDEDSKDLLEKQQVEEELRGLLYQLIRNKLGQFQDQSKQYEEKEVLLGDERRLLEKERHNLNQDQLSFEKLVSSVRQEIAKQQGGQLQHQQQRHDAAHALGYRGLDGGKPGNYPAMMNGNNPHQLSTMGMTPAQVQQQMAAHPTNGPPPMFMNAQQQQNYIRFQQQQQQIQLQLQMQMQQDQQQQRQHGPRPNHPQNYNMMSL
jgi:hypothetical protein